MFLIFQKQVENAYNYLKNSKKYEVMPNKYRTPLKSRVLGQTRKPVKS